MNKTFAFCIAFTWMNEWIMCVYYIYIYIYIYISSVKLLINMSVYCVYLVCIYKYKYIHVYI